MSELLNPDAYSKDGIAMAKLRNSFLKNALDLAVYFIVRIVVCVIQALPISVCKRMSKLLAAVIAPRMRERANVINENLSHSFPDWTAEQRDDVVQQMWQYLILMLCQIVHARTKIHQTNWREFISIEGRREMVTRLTDPRPLVVVTGHFGNFELGGFMTGMLGFRTYTMARPLDNPYLDRYITRFRETNGQFTIPKEGSAPLVSKVLEQGETMVLLGDQHAGSAGVWVDFMGKTASCHKALALFTLSGGAPMMVTYTRQLSEPMKFEVGVLGIADPDCLTEEQQGVRQLTQWYNDSLEKIIRKAPEQYWWLHRRWRARGRDHRRRPANKAANKAARQLASDTSVDASAVNKRAA